MATHARRISQCADSVLTLESQVDEVHVYVNNFEPVRLVEALTESGRSLERVFIHEARECVGDIGDAGKFWPALEKNGSGDDFFFFSTDDDIYYHPRYVQNMITALRRYRCLKVVSLHGKRFKGKIRSWRQDRTNVEWFHFNRVLRTDEAVHMTGTGLTAWHSSALPGLKLAELYETQHRNTADIQLARTCQRRGVGMICLAHPEQCVQLNPTINHASESIWADSARQDRTLTDLVNSIAWKLHT